MGIFLELKAAGTEVAGDVLIPKAYEKKINVQNMSFSYSGNVSRADGLSISNRNASEVSVSTTMGQHAVLIWKALVENEEIEATFTFDASDEGDAPEMKIMLKIGRITSTSFGLNGYGPLPDSGFSFSIAFSEIEIEHVESSMTHMDEVHTHA